MSSPAAAAAATDKKSAPLLSDELPAAAATDKKSAPLLSDELPTAAPPSYAESAAYSDGHIFSDQPRRQMIYTAAVRENYVPRSSTGSWSHHLFSCFSDTRAWVKAMCCPCISYGQTRHRLHSPGSPAPICSAPCMGYFLTAMVVPGAQHIFGFLQRNEIRQKLGINMPEERVQVGAQAGRERFCEGLQTALGFVNDAAAHFCCHCCALTQEEREVMRWEAEECGVAGQWAVDEENAAREEGERLLGSEEQGLRG